jgi:alanine dehydrogenase
VTALNAHGVNDVDVLTHREINAAASPIHTVRMVHFEQDPGDPGRCLALCGSGRVPLAAFLGQHDIMVNCVLQDTDAPLMFATTNDLGSFAPGSLIVDVSRQEGMGFDWARPTTFAEPMLAVGNNVHNYAVDHSPSHLWNSATWEISEALLPHLRPVFTGPQAWDANETIRRAIEIPNGVIQNPRILSFQHRSPGYPHPPRP